MNALILGSAALHEAPHALRGSIDLSKVTNLAAALAISNRNGISRFGDINSDKKILS
jgi:hypothetical protein